MAKKASKPTVSVTAGKNKPVNNVLKFEDLVQHLKQAASVPARMKAGAKTAPPVQLASIQKLATDLEQQLRAVRRAMPDKPASIRATPLKRKS